MSILLFCDRLIKFEQESNDRRQCGERLQFVVIADCSTIDCLGIKRPFVNSPTLTLVKLDQGCQLRISGRP